MTSERIAWRCGGPATIYLIPFSLIARWADLQSNSVMSLIQDAAKKEWVDWQKSKEADFEVKSSDFWKRMVDVQAGFSANIAVCILHHSTLHHNMTPWHPLPHVSLNLETSPRGSTQLQTPVNTRKRTRTGSLQTMSKLLGATGEVFIHLRSSSRLCVGHILDVHGDVYLGAQFRDSGFPCTRRPTRGCPFVRPRSTTRRSSTSSRSSQRTWR